MGCSQDIIQAALLVGTAIGFLVSSFIFTGWGLGEFFQLREKRQKKYQKLTRTTEKLLKENQFVTLTDLVFESGLSPKECKQFLDKFVVEVDGDIESNEFGKIYYRFPTAKSIKFKELKGE